MSEKQKILLPGGTGQFNHLIKYAGLNEKQVLIIGANSEALARMFLNKKASAVKIIVDDYDSLLNSRLILKKDDIPVRLMEYDNTDFNKGSFDIVYSQAGISTPVRNKVIKEIKRIVKPDGVISIGEIVSLKHPVPQFVTDVWELNGIDALNMDDLKEFYTSKNLEVLDMRNLSGTLSEFYKQIKELVSKKGGDIPVGEESYYKKLIKRIVHEANAYLKLGGDKYMGFVSIIMRNKS